MSADSALSDVKQTLDELKEDRQDFIEVLFFDFIDVMNLCRMLKNLNSLHKKKRPNLQTDLEAKSTRLLPRLKQN